MLTEEDNQYLFEVAPGANKIEIKSAVESLFSVKVSQVRTQIVRGKIKRRGLHVGKRKNWKKAIVSVAQPGEINFYEGVV